MRVFILGAGASHHAGYPLAADLGRRLAAWITTLPPGHDYRAYLRQVAELYGGLDDFEAILGDLMTLRPGSPTLTLPPAFLPPLLTNLTEAIRDYFNSIRAGPAPLYDKLAQIIRPGDSVITFNYDLAVERALCTAGLWDVRTGYGFNIGDSDRRSPVEIIKLHGSTNWRALLFGGRTRGTFQRGLDSLGHRAIVPCSDLEYLGHHESVDPLSVKLQTGASLPAMIMPAVPKRFHFETSLGIEWKGFWDVLWDRAKDALEGADELVIIGYSMPTIDERSQDMLLDTQNKSVRLSICCGKATARLKEELRGRGFNRLQPAATTFDDFLMAEAGGIDIETAQPGLLVAGRASGQNNAASAKATVLPVQRILMAAAKLRHDGRATLSIEGTPLQDQILTVDQLQRQLRGNGAFSENIEKFVGTLQATGSAEIRQPKLMNTCFTLG
jgi:hypothetical protein